MTFHNEDGWPVEHSTVRSVDHYENGGFAVTQESGWSFFVTSEEANKFIENPEPGDEVTVLGGLGHQIRGIFIAGREYRYVSKAQAEKQRTEWLQEYAREREERFYTNVASYVERTNALSEPFRNRINRFAGEKGFKEFWTEDGGYELFAVEQADQLLKFAANVPGVKVNNDVVEWLDKFSAADYDEQKEMWPGLDDGHSGNTFGGMVGLAKAVARGNSI